MNKDLIEKLRQAIETTALGVIEDVILDAGGTVDGHPRDGLITYNNADGEIVLEVTIDDDITTFALYTHTGDDFDPRWIADIYKVNRKTGYRHWDYNINCGEWR